MRDLDETDLTILELLTENARAAYSDIAEAVELSAPAVSDRVDRLEEAGVIRGFTLDLDRSQLQGGLALLVEVDVATGETETVRAAIDEAQAVEHVFETADGDIVFHARVPKHRVRDLLADIVGAAVDESRSADDRAPAPTPVQDYEVTMLTEVDWTPTVSGSGFALTCAECGNTVTSEGQTSRIDDTVYHFCCRSCEDRFEQRYERLENSA